MRALALVALVACDDGNTSVPPDVPVNATPREVITETVPLVVTEIVEAVLVGGAGDYARIKLTAPTPSLDWNIHGHADGGTQIVAEELKVMSVDYVFTPTAQADWYLLLRNRGTTDMTVQLEIQLFGDITWSGWQ